VDFLKRIFISRSLDEGSPFLNLVDKGYEIIDRSLVVMNGIACELEISSDWIFFYSKSGVRYFFESQEYSTQYQYGVMGPGTASTFYQITGRSPKYTGNGIPKDVANNFITYESGRSITFAKAKNSKNSIRQLLEDHMDCHDIAIYDNAIMDKVELPDCKYLIFTSPLNAKAYFQQKSYNNESIIAIGQTTSDYLMKITGKTVPYGDFPSETDMYDLLLSMIHEDPTEESRISG